METFIFFRHRHKNEFKALQTSFNCDTKVNNHFLKKLRQTQKVDWSEKVIEECKNKKFDTFGCMEANYVDVFVVEENKAIAQQIYVINNNNTACIYNMETKCAFRRKGIATNALSEVEKILFEKLEVNKISSLATDYSRRIFKKRGYKLKPYTPRKELSFIGDGPCNTEITLTRENYFKRNIEKEK